MVTPVGADEEGAAANMPTSGRADILLSLFRPHLLFCNVEILLLLSLKGLDISGTWDHVLKASTTVSDLVDARFNHLLKIRFQGDILMGTFTTNSTTEKNYSKMIPLIPPHSLQKTYMTLYKHKKIKN